jgi:tetratricopeptide (TPR) repeat protein/CHAT domain-containing protein
MKRVFLIILLALPFTAHAQTWAELDSIGFYHYQYGRYKSAVDNWKLALTKAETDFGTESEQYATTLHAIGSVYMEAGRYDIALKYLLPALEVKEKVYGKESESYANTLNNLGSTTTYMGNYLEAEKYILEAKAIRQKLFGTESGDYSVSLNNLAYLYQMMSRYEDAEKLFIESIRIKEKTDGIKSEDYAQGVNNLGYLYQVMSRYSEAERLYLESAKIRKELLTDKHPDYAMSLSNLGVLYDELGSFDKSILLFEEAKAIIEGVFPKTHPDYGMVVNNLAAAYSGIHNYPMAEQYYLESVDIYRKTVGEKNPYYAMALSNLATLYNDQNKHSEAIAIYKKALPILDSTVGNQNPRYADMLVKLGVCYHELRMLPQADSCYSEALTIKIAAFGDTHHELAPLKNSMAGLYWNMNDIKKAREFFLNSVETFYSQLESQSTFLSETEMSKFLHENGYFIKSFYSFCHYNYQKDPTLISEMNKLYSAVNGKLLKNVNQLKLKIAQSTDSTLVNKYNEWHALKKNINKELSLPPKFRNEFVGDWEKKCVDLEKDLIRSSSSFQTNLKSKEKDWKEVQGQLKPDEAVIEFVSFSLNNGYDWVDSVMYSAIVIRPGDPQPLYVPLFEESHLEGLMTGDTIRTFANLLYTHAQVRNVEHHDIGYGDSLYKLIWKPLESYLTNVKHIYYSPSADLHTISHNAIPISDDQVLSDRFHLDRITSDHEFNSGLNETFQLSSINMFGGLVYDIDTTTLGKEKNKRTKVSNEFYSEDTDGSRGGSWNYLPGAKKEVESINEFLKKNKVKTVAYYGMEGREELIKKYDSKNCPSILHFSTHGFFFPDPGSTEKHTNNDHVFTTANNPLFRSGLILSGGNYVWKGNKPIDGVEDGILTAYEVSNLYLPSTKLVVMSACETGLGDIKRSEGVYGLQRAFKMAGVEYIIVTLWQVLDKETSEFMILFYQNLLTQKSIPLAFNATQNEMKNRYRDEPYKWAGFVLIK